MAIRRVPRAARRRHLDLPARPSIRLPYPEVFDVSADEIPYLRPEVCLLFKAKAVRDKDRADFEAALPRMSAAQRNWLHTALRTVHPDHDWISATE